MKPELKMKRKIYSLIQFIGDNPERTGLKETPKRVVKMYKEIFKGYDKKNFPKVTTFPNNDDGIKYNQIIADEGYFYSHCEHHVVPFFGQYYFGYIPNKKVLGISKIARIIDFYSSKLQIQERLTQEIVDYFQKLLNTLAPLNYQLVMKVMSILK